MGKLTASAVRGLRSRGRYSDGDGLALSVTAPDKRYWTFRYQRQGRERAMTFGNADKVSLAGARARAAQARALLVRDIDPLEAKQRDKAEKAARVSFTEAVETYVEAHQASWRGYHATERWRQSLADYAEPVFGRKPIGEVSVEDVLRSLKPIWTTKTATASRVRSRIELVLDYAKARGWRQGENPAVWRGNLRMLLPPTARVHRVEHRAALAWQQAPALMTALSAETDMASRCLAFLTLTATRSAEARGARWSEIDLDETLWIIPAARTKTSKEHRVPLSPTALAILHALAALRTCDLVFFGRQGLPLADTTLKLALRRAGHGDVTVHGMRSTFRNWCADTGKQGDLAEAALAHVVGNAVVRAYQRSDLMERRRVLMEQWAAFLTQPPAVVVPLRSRSHGSAA
jgi:integrase